MSEAPIPFRKPFSTAVRVGEILYLSGEIGIDYATGRVVPGGIAREAEQAMENIGRTLDKNGLGFGDVFKCTVMLADMAEWAIFNEIYLRYFQPDRLPARSAFGCNGLALGARVEIECMALFST